MASKGQEKQFIFVGGPTLTTKGSGIRSKLIQDTIRKNKLTEMNKLLKERTHVECTCRLEMTPASQSLMRGQSVKMSASGPEIEGPVVEFIRCSFCSRIFDPMLPVDELTSQLKVREIFSFACQHIFPNLRPVVVTTQLYHSWAFRLDDKLRLFSFLWSSKYQEDVLRLTYEAPVDPAGLKEQYTLKGLTLMALQNEVSTYTGQKPIDSIIMCMLVLAVNETVSEQIYRDSSPFSPMFTGLHGLEVYGSRD
ncbi:hypothetical protein BJY00DRAFT_318901 [Aspergillus carlsbadensis]|nr:hypothetical protein BJY00DRAFT_318901 [Aspergillus carlsbadensis]